MTEQQQKFFLRERIACNLDHCSYIAPYKRVSLDFLEAKSGELRARRVRNYKMLPLLTKKFYSTHSKNIQKYKQVYYDQTTTYLGGSA